MSKKHRVEIRISDNLKSKIDSAAQKKGLSNSDYIRDVLLHQSELVLMGKNDIPDRAILVDIWKRISFVEGSVKHHKDTDNDLIEKCDGYSKLVEEKIRSEN